MNVLKSKFEVDVKGGIAGINAFTKALQSVGKVSDGTKRALDILAHSSQAFIGLKETAKTLIGTVKNF
ncbi:hypothetical protein [Campylobacter geochelonis]|uniref:hypothetical protein n=1 Tax=Campylobacter geochelonis TaxID=1780362 RepID=UPI000770888F|nr:hypothetical protein [Campylobacter geochelonis]CZE47309.1 Uncharacterised protein [Campylobacter geochelonis]CZE50536.1 Uncharacterised protein [Campylobacter geochelonis]